MISIPNSNKKSLRPLTEDMQKKMPPFTFNALFRSHHLKFEYNFVTSLYMCLCCGLMSS